jgi:hypothetical protein
MAMRKSSPREQAMRWFDLSGIGRAPRDSISGNWRISAAIIWPMAEDAALLHEFRHILWPPGSLPLTRAGRSSEAVTVLPERPCENLSGTY